MRSWRIRSLAFVLLAAAAACTGGGRTATPAGGVGSAAAPAQVVEQFMRMVAAKDYARMGTLFGTVEGPISARDPAQQVERRMYAIAEILRHERFVIRGQQGIPGRADAEQITVQITQDRRTVNVPFVVVRSPSAGWLVEQVDLEAVTRRQ